MVENRIAERSRCKMRAEVTFEGEVIRCVICDMSVRGARLTLPCAKELPRSFTLAFPWQDRACVRKRWQNGFSVGVEFELVATITPSRFIKVVDELAETKKTVERLSKQLATAENLAYSQ